MSPNAPEDDDPTAGDSSSNMVKLKLKRASAG
jgi:hypothetical protein